MNSSSGPNPTRIETETVLGFRGYGFWLINAAFSGGSYFPRDREPSKPFEESFFR